MNAQRSAIVTGGARGMGLACARRLAADGHSVHILDLDRRTVEAAVASLPTESGPHVGSAADITARNDVEIALREAESTVGRPVILVNNAGVLRPTRFLDISESEWRTVVSVSLDGAFICSQLCLPSMIESGWGRIVNFSSTAGKTVSTLGGAHYTAAKTGVLGLTRALAAETAACGVTVNAVCPGLIDTEMSREQCSEEELKRYADSFPIKRLGSPDEVANLVSFLCSPEAAYITGAALDINGGDLMI